MSSAPKEANIWPIQLTESPVVPRPVPKGMPILWQASATLRYVSYVQLAASGEPSGRAGYMARTSTPACFRMLIRPMAQ
jgi:hypothetical protein